MLLAATPDCRRRPRGVRHLRADAPAPEGAGRGGPPSRVRRSRARVRPRRQRRSGRGCDRLQRHGARPAARTEALVAADDAGASCWPTSRTSCRTPVTAMRGYLETLTMPELGLDEATRARYLAIVERRNRAPRADHRRPARPGPARRRRRHVGIETVQTTELFARVVARHERAAAAAHVRIQTGDRPRSRDRRCRSHSPGAGAPEPCCQRAALLAAGRGADTAARNDDSSVALLVSDAGPGIPAEHLPRVFDRFHKVEESRTAQAGAGGSGLGLSIVKAIVERHGAHISVTSEPGRTLCHHRPSERHWSARGVKTTFADCTDNHE